MKKSLASKKASDFYGAPSGTRTPDQTVMGRPL